LGVRHFRYLLDGRNFHILTDHKPLTQALHRVSDPWTARQQRQLSFLAELTADVRHVAGKANVVADALSRPPLNTQPGTGLLQAETCGRQPPIIRPGPQSPASAVEEAGFVASLPVQLPGLDYRLLAAEQKQCEVTQKLLSSSSLQLQEFPIQGASLLCDVSWGVRGRWCLSHFGKQFLTPCTGWPIPVSEPASGLFHADLCGIGWVQISALSADSANSA
jgi:hypothetical protein